MRSAQKLALPLISRIACAFYFSLASAPTLIINTCSFLIQQLVMAPWCSTGITSKQTEVYLSGQSLHINLACHHMMDSSLSLSHMVAESKRLLNHFTMSRTRGIDLRNGSFSQRKSPTIKFICCTQHTRTIIHTNIDVSSHHAFLPSGPSSVHQAIILTRNTSCIYLMSPRMSFKR
jgi:hypothetical protein